MIVEPFEDDYNVVSTDYLCFKDHEKHSVHDLHLEYLLQDKYYFIVSPNDIFFGKPRDEDDHVEWLITQKEVCFKFVYIFKLLRSVCLLFLRMINSFFSSSKKPSPTQKPMLNNYANFPYFLLVGIMLTI